VKVLETGEEGGETWKLLFEVHVYKLRVVIIVINDTNANIIIKTSQT
jgi:hypothetical protein